MGVYPRRASHETHYITKPCPDTTVTFSSASIATRMGQRSITPCRCRAYSMASISVGHHDRPSRPRA
jgi:hypothetical protein